MLSEDSASNVRWLRLDTSTLKQQLTSSCDNWVAAFSGLLASLASRQLVGLEEELHAHCAALEGGGGSGAAGAAGAAEVGEGPAAAEAEAGAQGAAAESAASTAGELEASPPAAPTREQQFEALEALQGRLLGEREALQEGLAVCQERYEALVGLQVGCAAWEVNAWLAGYDAVLLCRLACTGGCALGQCTVDLHTLCSPPMCTRSSRCRCPMASWSAWTHCQPSGSGLWRRLRGCQPACVNCAAELSRLGLGHTVQDVTTAVKLQQHEAECGKQNWLSLLTVKLPLE